MTRRACLLTHAAVYAAAVALFAALASLVPACARSVAVHDGYAARCNPAAENASTDYCAEIFGARR